MNALHENEDEPFGTWLLSQHDHGGWIGDLAKAARTDRLFPKLESLGGVRAHLNKNQAEGDMFEAVDDAETLWRSGA